jgi:hypothetical protein
VQSGPCHYNRQLHGGCEDALGQAFRFGRNNERFLTTLSRLNSIIALAKIHSEFAGSSSKHGVHSKDLIATAYSALRNFYNGFRRSPPGTKKFHNYAVCGMGSVQFLRLPYPAAPGQYWRWDCPQNARLRVPGFGVTIGDTFRIDRCIDGDEPDPEMPEFARSFRTCEVTLVGNKNSDPMVPDATGILEYSL